MISSIVIASLTCISLVLCVLFKPRIKIKTFEFQTFWVVSLIGALLLLTLRILPFNVLFNNLLEDSVVNPFKILILFICLSMISITLDCLGFFKYLAVKVANKFNKSQYYLFFSLYILIALLTMFTSNDIVILTFTPFICYFSKNAKISPIPFLVMQFIVANTYSMALYIGNPTNIYLSQASNVNFLEYLKVMWLPTLFAGITSLVLLLLVFRKQLSQKIVVSSCEEVKIEHKLLTGVSLSILLICTFMLAISNYINIEMWLICLLCAFVLSLILGIVSLCKGKKLLGNVYKRLPYNLIFFVLAMYTIVLSLEYNDVTVKIAEGVSRIATTKYSQALVYGSSSIVFDNLINNIPMSILFSSIVQLNFSQVALYAVIIGSNIGAYLTPVGALAGIMWMSILKKQEINYSFVQFVKYGVLFVPVILIASLVGLLIVL